MTVQCFVILFATLAASLLMFEVFRHILPTRIVLGIKGALAFNIFYRQAGECL